MRIVQIVPSLESRHGGPSVSVPALANALAKLGHDVELLSTGPAAETRVSTSGATVRVFPRGWPGAICPSRSLRAALDFLPADVLHSHGLWLRPLDYAHRRARALGVPHVISPRGMMTPWAWQRHRLQKSIAGRLLHPGALAAAAGWHATSPEEAEDIAALGFEQPICVAPNGVSAPAPLERSAATSYWKKACPEAFSRPTALFYSRLHVKKRVLELIDLWLVVAPQDWLLVVAGIPETYSVTELQAHAAKAGAAGRVKIFDATDAPQPYVMASLFLLPSHSENFGLVVAEALANGLPALVTDTTPWKPLHAAGHGWCVPWERFGDALRDALAAGTGSLAARGAAARDWVIAEYSWEKSARALSGFYTRLKS